LDVSAEGDLFIADTGGSRVVWSDASGQMIAVFGGANTKFASSQPTDVAVDDAGFLYVPDPANGLFWQIQIDTGEMLSAPGPKSNTVESPHVATAEDGRIFLTDPENGRILIFDQQLRPLAELGGKGNAPGQFSRVVGIAVGQGMVVSTDPDLCRVTAFSLDK